jgi:hypothetical protein
MILPFELRGLPTLVAEATPSCEALVTDGPS